MDHHPNPARHKPLRGFAFSGVVAKWHFDSKFDSNAVKNMGSLSMVGVKIK